MRTNNSRYMQEVLSTMANYDHERERAQQRVNLLDWMIAWEQGALSAQGEITLFQALVNNGMAWTLQGTYGRQAAAMLDAGLITSPFQSVADSDTDEFDDIDSHVEESSWPGDIPDDNGERWCE